MYSHSIMILMMLFVVSMEGVGAVKLCPLGWTGFREEKCYRSVKEMMIWEDANSYCNTLGGNVAVITSEEEEEALKDMIESDTDFHEKWISVRKPIDTSGWFVEDEGKSSEESSDKHVLRLRCVYMFYEEKSWSERKTLDCPGKAYFICEMESVQLASISDLTKSESKIKDDFEEELEKLRNMQHFLNNKVNDLTRDFRKVKNQTQSLIVQVGDIKKDA